MPSPFATVLAFSRHVGPGRRTGSDPRTLVGTWRSWPVFYFGIHRRGPPHGESWTTDLISVDRRRRRLTAFS